MNWALWFGYGEGVVSINALLAHLKFLPNFHDENLEAFHLIFMVAFRLWCIIAHEKLFSPSFHYKNMVIKVPHFYGENSKGFRIW